MVRKMIELKWFWWCISLQSSCLTPVASLDNGLSISEVPSEARNLGGGA